MVACDGFSDLRDDVAHHDPFFSRDRHHLYFVTHIVNGLHYGNRNHNGLGLPASEADDTVFVVVNSDDLVICRADLDPCSARVHPLGIEVFVNLLSYHADLAFLRHVHLVDVASVNYRRCLYFCEVGLQPLDVAP